MFLDENRCSTMVFQCFFGACESSALMTLEILFANLKSVVYNDRLNSIRFWRFRDVATLFADAVRSPDGFGSEC